MMLGRLQYQTYSSDTTTVQLYLQYHSKLSHTLFRRRDRRHHHFDHALAPGKAARRRKGLGTCGLCMECSVYLQESAYITSHEDLKDEAKQPLSPG